MLPAVRMQNRLISMAIIERHGTVKQNIIGGGKQILFLAKFESFNIMMVNIFLSCFIYYLLAFNIFCCETYQGPVVFLEEDHYVAEDFLHVLWLQHLLLTGEKECSFCTQARILSLGSYPKTFNHRDLSDVVNSIILF